MNIFDFALKMELDGKEYYEKLATTAPTTGLATIFTRLAADEQKHYDVIQGLKAGVTGTMTDTTVLEESKNLFQDLTKDTSIIGSMRKDLDGYRHAMKVEADSVRLYEDAARKENTKETSGMLLKIAAEEKKHYNIMENIYDFVLAPEYFLAWREFSNLKDL
jgi:rubrerythrin